MCIWRRRRNNPANQGWQADKGEREFGDGQEAETLDITTTGGKPGSKRSSLLGFTRQSRLLGQETLPSPSTARSTTMEGLQSPFNPPSFRSSSVASSKGNQGLGANRESAMGSNREDSLIALSNMGSRPKYRAVPSDGYDTKERNGTPHATRSAGAQHHRGVGVSGSDSGSGGAGNAARDRSDSESQARFKGYTGRGRGESVTNQSDTNISVLSSATTRIQHQAADAAPNATGFAPRNLKKDEDDESIIGYANSGIGLGIYSQSNNHYAGSNADHLQRVADLKRSVSVASSGIVDRLGTSSPPPVPELPSSIGTEPSLYSQVQTANEGYRYSITGAAKVKHPYGKNNEMLIFGNKVPETGTQPLRPPPLKRASQTRLRSSSGSLSNMLASQSGSPDPQSPSNLHPPGSGGKHDENRYSRPPPSYSPSERSSFLGMASQSSIVMPSQASSAMQSQVTIPPSAGTYYQRSTTHTGDIPIGLEGFNSTEFEVESQESHSVAHAEVQMAKQINVNNNGPVPSVAPLNIGKIPAPTSQYERSHLPYAKPPVAPSSQTSHSTTHTLQEQRKGALAPTIGQFPGGPQAASNRRARTPESNRSYTPDRTMVVPGGRSYTPDRVPAADRYGGGRPSEDRVWTLDGVSGQGRPSLERQRLPPPPSSQLPPPPIGAPILVDRTRNAMTSSSARNPPRRP